jgi:predicted MPP superfamily phosphohydrolase
MALPPLQTKQNSSRRDFLKAGLFGAAGLTLYSGELERHWIDVAHRDVELRGLAHDLQGMRIVQLSDIHMDNFTEPFFLRRVIERINQLKPDAVFLTGDFVTCGENLKLKAHEAAWQCAAILRRLECQSVYAALGNHDVSAGAADVESALRESGIQVVRNSYLPIERGSGRLWLAGLDDPLVGQPNLDEAVPESIRGLRNEPVVLMCHAPDYATGVQSHPAGQAVGLMLSGHTHGGQIRLPLIGALVLPPMGQKYIEGWFQLGSMKLYVNRGIGTIGLPFRLDCPPEITVFTLRAAAA